MTKRTEAERLADRLETDHRLDSPNEEAAAELRRLVSFNNDLMDEVARLNKALAEQPAQQEPVALPCCGYTDASAVKWNSYNQVVQCHNCGQVYSTPQPPAQPQEFKGVLPFGSTPTEPGLWLSFNDGRIYVWQETGWIESANGITKGQP